MIAQSVAVMFLSVTDLVSLFIEFLFGDQIVICHWRVSFRKYFFVTEYLCEGKNDGIEFETFFNRLVANLFDLLDSLVLRTKSCFHN